jgi:serine/threonine protein kinase
MSNLVGEQIAHYQIQALLGQGRIGTVYQAIDLENQSLVALKVVSLHLTQNPEFRRSFLQEVQAIPTLEHPSIVKVYEAGVDTEQDILYMTMDYVTERSLMAYLQQLEYQGENLSPEEALLIGAQVAEALSHAHQKGVLHRDIRPNIILFKLDDDSPEIGGRRRRAVIGDFALATVLDEETEPFTPALPYMPPEQCLKKGLDGRSDIYSLGILLYQILTAQLPFAVESLEDAIEQHQYQDPLPPRRLRPDLPQMVEDIVLKAIEKRPDDRFQSAQEMAEALRRALSALPKALTAAKSGDEISSVQTLFEPPDQLARHWASDEDRVTITQDVPYHLNRQIVTIGRSENNDISLPATNVTRRHAQLERTRTGWQIRDLGSRNGTYLDGHPLLPDIPEEWLSHQTLRIGPYYLQLQEGKGFAVAVQPFSAMVTPNEIDVLVGQQRELQVTVINQGTTTEDYQIQVDRLPSGWVSPPQEPLRIRAGERATASIMIHPPLSGDIITGKSRYLVIVCALMTEQEEIFIPGTVNVCPAEDVFSIEMNPTQILGEGDCRLLIRNEGVNEATYTIVGHNSDEAIRFGEWRPRQEARAAGRPAGTGRARPRSSFLGRFPQVRRLQTAPRSAYQSAMSAPRRALNRILPGLGSMLRIDGLGRQATTAVSSKVLVKRPPRIDYGKFDEIVYAGQLRTRVSVAAGEEREVNLSIAPRKRSWLGRENKTLPFQLQVSSASGERQSEAGQLSVKPRVQTQWPVTLLLLLLLLVCGLSSALYVATLNPTIAAMLSTPRDVDKDGLSNLAELYLHKTDPNAADTDRDGLSDGHEIEQELSATNPDTDNDGLLDGEEQDWNTDARAYDTDGDELSDSLEVRVLNTDPLATNVAPFVIVMTPTPLPQATPQPAPTTAPIPTPSANEMRFTSQAEEDGFVGQEFGVGGLAIHEGESIQIGDDISDGRQFKGFLSFDTSPIPDDAIIQTVQLRLRRSGAAGAPYNLGQIHVDVAPTTGFNDDPALESDDFAAAAAIVNVAILSETSSNGTWSIGLLSQANAHAVNRGGVTQFRLYFTLPSDGNGDRDWIDFSSGDHPNGSYHPQLVVGYEVP